MLTSQFTKFYRQEDILPRKWDVGHRVIRIVQICMRAYLTFECLQDSQNRQICRIVELGWKFIKKNGTLTVNQSTMTQRRDEYPT